MTQGHLLGGRYQVGELLGYGGMAEVHHGRDLRLGRDVAIKTLRTDLARDAMFQMRFRREAQNAAALNHPAIVAVYDTGEERGQHGEALPYIIMEYVNGRTLKEVLADEGRLDSRRAMEVVAEICSALDFSHKHGIIHRDIKPGNVMLTQTDQVKVMDFGIARALASNAATMTQTSAVIGTAQYLSPEQARGEPVDARSDVYATGCVLFELLCTRPPFVGDNPVSVAYQHVREEPRPPSTHNPDVPPDLDAVVLKALAKNPLNRYQSAGEMREDLIRAVSGRPVSAPPVLSEDQMTAMLNSPEEQTKAMRPAGSGARRGTSRASARKRRDSSITVLISLSVLAAIAAIALGIGIWFNSNSTVKVPNIVGMTEDAGTTALADAKLASKQGSIITTTDCTIGQITAQDPPEGTEVREGATISYDICTGPGETTVPAMIGLDQDGAKRALEDAGLEGDFQTVDSSKEEGVVVDTDPEVGTAVANGTTIVVYISKGNQREVPTLTGQDPDTARETLRNSGFTNVREVSTTTTDPTKAGVVLNQDPDPGKTVSTDTQITIYVGELSQTSSPPSATPTTTAPATPSPSTSS